MPEPKPVDLVQQLEEAMYGESIARPATPQNWWDTLLLHVARRFCCCPPSLPAGTYDCEVCAVAHRRMNNMRERP